MVQYMTPPLATANILHSPKSFRAPADGERCVHLCEFLFFCCQIKCQTLLEFFFVFNLFFIPFNSDYLFPKCIHFCKYDNCEKPVHIRISTFSSTFPALVKKPPVRMLLGNSRVPTWLSVWQIHLIAGRPLPSDGGFLDELAARAAHIMVNNLATPSLSPKPPPPPFTIQKSGSWAAWRLHLDTSSLTATAHQRTQPLLSRLVLWDDTRWCHLVLSTDGRHTGGNIGRKCHIWSCTTTFITFFFFNLFYLSCIVTLHLTGFERDFWHLLYYGGNEETRRPWMPLEIILPRLLAEIGFSPNQMSTL